MKNVPMNLNEAKWVLDALREYIRTPAFDNDPERVAQMGALLTKVAVAANSNLKG